MNANVARSLGAAGLLLAATALGMIDTNGFILVKHHWSQGSTGTSCIEPWGQRPYYKDGPHKVVNAYYVTTPPNLTGPPGDQRCSLSQPRV